MDDIEKIKEKKKKELLNKSQNENKSNSENNNKKAVKKHLLRKILTEDARKRISNIKLVNEKKAHQLENQLIQIAQSKNIDRKITEDELKNALKDSTQSKKFNIKRK